MFAAGSSCAGILSRHPRPAAPCADSLSALRRRATRTLLSGGEDGSSEGILALVQILVPALLTEVARHSARGARATHDAFALSAPRLEAMLSTTRAALRSLRARPSDEADVCAACDELQRLVLPLCGAVLVVHSGALLHSACRSLQAFLRSMPQRLHAAPAAAPHADSAFATRIALFDAAASLLAPARALSDAAVLPAAELCALLLCGCTPVTLSKRAAARTARIT